jgi:hypothetical protein
MFETSHGGLYRVYTFRILKGGAWCRIRAVGASSRNAIAKIRSAGHNGSIKSYVSRQATVDDILNRDEAPVFVDERGRVKQ